MENDITNKENKENNNINLININNDQETNINNNIIKNNKDNSSLFPLENIKKILSLVKKESSNKKICKSNFNNFKLIF